MEAKIIHQDCGGQLKADISFGPTAFICDRCDKKIPLEVNTGGGINSTG